MVNVKYYSEDELVEKFQSGEDGSLDYIPEESYTDDIWQEQKKQGLRMMQR